MCEREVLVKTWTFYGKGMKNFSVTERTFEDFQTRKETATQDRSNQRFILNNIMLETKKLLTSFHREQHSINLFFDEQAFSLQWTENRKIPAACTNISRGTSNVKQENPVQNPAKDTSGEKCCIPYVYHFVEKWWWGCSSGFLHFCGNWNALYPSLFYSGFGGDAQQDFSHGPSTFFLLTCFIYLFLLNSPLKQNTLLSTILKW